MGTADTCHIDTFVVLNWRYKKPFGSFGKKNVYILLITSHFPENGAFENENNEIIFHN